MNYKYKAEQENKEDTYKDSKFIIPDVRLRNLVLGWELVLVQEISVLNVLSKPRIKKFINTFMMGLLVAI